MTKWILICFVLSCYLPSLLAIDKLYMKDGKELSGYVRGETAKFIRFQDVDGGDATIDIEVSDVDYVIRESASNSYKLGIENFRRNNFVSANKYFRQSLRMAPKDLYSTYYYGVSMVKTPNLPTKTAEKLIPFFNKIKSENEDHRFALSCDYYIGLLYLRTKDLDKAKSQFKRLMASSRPDIKTLSRRGIVELSMVTKDYGEVENQFKASLAAKQFDPFIIQQYTSYLIDIKKDYAKANKYGKTLEKIVKGPARFYVIDLLACSEAKLENYETAFENFLKADLLFGNTARLSQRSRFLYAMSLKQLMNQKKDDYPSWEYARAMSNLTVKLTGKNKKQLDDLKL